MEHSAFKFYLFFIFLFFFFLFFFFSALCTLACIITCIHIFMLNIYSCIILVLDPFVWLVHKLLLHLLFIILQTYFFLPHSFLRACSVWQITDWISCVRVLFPCHETGCKQLGMTSLKHVPERLCAYLLNYITSYSLYSSQINPFISKSSFRGLETLNALARFAWLRA